MLSDEELQPRLHLDPFGARRALGALALGGRASDRELEVGVPLGERECLLQQLGVARSQGVVLSGERRDALHRCVGGGDLHEAAVLIEQCLHRMDLESGGTAAQSERRRRAFKG